MSFDDIFGGETRLEKLIDEATKESKDLMRIYKQSNSMVIGPVDDILDLVFVKVPNKKKKLLKRKREYKEIDETNVKIRRLEELSVSLADHQSKNEEIMKEFIIQSQADDSTYKGALIRLTKNYKRRKKVIYKKMTKFIIEQNEDSRRIRNDIRNIITRERVKMVLVKQEVSKFFSLIAPWAIYEEEDFINLSLVCKRVHSIMKHCAIAIRCHDKRPVRMCLYGKDKLGEGMKRLEHIKISPHPYKMNKLSDAINPKIKKLTLDFHNCYPYDHKRVDDVVSDNRFTKLKTLEIMNTRIVGRDLIKLISVNIDELVLYNCTITDFTFDFYLEYSKEYYSVDIKRMVLINCILGGFKLRSNLRHMPFNELFICSTEGKKYFSDKNMGEDFCKYDPSAKNRKFFLLFDAKNLPKKNNRSVDKNIVKYGKHIEWKPVFHSGLKEYYVRKVNQFANTIRSILDDSTGDVASTIYSGINRFRSVLNGVDKQLKEY